MNRPLVAALLALALLARVAPTARAAAAAEPGDAEKLYDRVSKSLVAVQYVWENEMGRRELTGAGVVVGEDGLVMTSIALFDTRIADKQMKEFKILVPSQEHETEEIDAVFQGRDERTNTAFIKPKEPQKWPVLK